MSEIPEIVALRRDRVFEPYPEATHLVRLDDAERELRSALDRQAREIVEALRAKGTHAADVLADQVEAEFCSKEGTDA